ncbi:MAG: beta-propeller repeat-containing protein [Acidobacteriaceae bacterium]|nr:beta-propeller repeat-containing protein [Acidobacteriaceae bacterium]
MRKPCFRTFLKCAAGLFAIALSASAQSLLVVNQEDSNVSVIDPVSRRETARISENTPGVHGHEIATSADGKTAWLPIYGNSGVGKPGLDGHEMLVIDVPSRKIVAHVDFGHGVRPHLPVLDSERGLLYVTTEMDKSVTIVDAKTNRIIGTVPTSQAESHMLAISHDGRFGYTANVGPGTVSVLDLVGRKTVAVIPVAASQGGWGVQRISISPDDRSVFTADQTQPRLAVIDTRTKRVSSWVPLPGLGYGSAVTQDGRWLLIALPKKDAVAVVDLHSMKVTRTIPVAANPQAVLIPADGKVAYVSCAGAGKVAAVDLADWHVASIDAGGFADGLAWAP